MLKAAMIFAVALGLGLALGWQLHAKTRDRGLEVRAQAAEIASLHAALADSQKRCARQAEWLKSLEAELTLAKGSERANQSPLLGRKALI